MKLKEYIKYLEDFVNDFPDTLEMDCVYASDSEGNDYEYVHYHPSLQFINSNMECVDKEDWEDYHISGPNCVCIN